MDVSKPAPLQPGSSTYTTPIANVCYAALNPSGPHPRNPHPPQVVYVEACMACNNYRAALSAVRTFELQSAFPDVEKVGRSAGAPQ